jgi:hypothetical protein
VPTEPIPVTQRIVSNFYAAKRMLHALGLTIQRHEATPTLAVKQAFLLARAAV